MADPSEREKPPWAVPDDAADSPAAAQAQADESAADPPSGGWSPASADAAAWADDPFARRPEVYVGAAFAGGVLLAGALRLLSR